MREYDLIELTQGSKNNCHERGLQLKVLDSAPFRVRTSRNATCLRDYYAQ